MLSKNTFSALDALKAAAIGNTEMDHIRQTLEAINGTAMQKAHAMGSVGILAQQARDLAGTNSMSALVRQMNATALTDSPAVQQFKAVMESLKPGGLAAKLHQDWAKSMGPAKDLDWAKHLVGKSFAGDSVQAQFVAFQEREAAAVAKQLRTVGSLSGLLPQSAIEQLLGARRGQDIKELLGRFSDLGTLAAMGGSLALQGQVDVAVTGVETAVTAAGDQTLQVFLVQLITAIHSIGDPIVRALLVVLYNPLFLVLLGVALSPIANEQVPLLFDKGKSEREVVKHIKSQTAAEVGSLAVLSEHRFVSVKTLVVRSSASAGAPRVGELRFGQVVLIADRKKDFTLVVWSSEDGSVQIRGWVFSRYLKSFS